MKKKVNQASDVNLSIQAKKRREEYLKYILSPLEQSALNSKFEPFSFEMNGKSIYFSRYASKQLITLTSHIITLISHRLDVEVKAVNVPPELREVFEDPTQVLSLAPYVRIRLCKYGCYTMLEIISKGRVFFLDKPEFGKKSMIHIDNLFKKYKCEGLFT